MATVGRSITINAPVEKVFAYIADPRNELETVPSITDIRDIIGQGVGQRYSWTYKMMGISLKGESEVIEYVPNERYVTRSTGGIISTWTWTVKPEGDGTQLNLVVEYTIPVPVLGKVGERLVSRQNQREADLAMATLKDRLEG